MPDGNDGTSLDDTDAGERLASAYREPDPEGNLPDPESDLPNVPSTPSVEIPTPPTSKEGVPDELLAGFWTTVLVFNVAILATSLGLLVLFLGSQRRLGLGALIVGLAAGAHGYWKYRSLADRHRSGEWTEGSSGEEPSEASSEDGPAEASSGDGPVESASGEEATEQEADREEPQADRDQQEADREEPDGRNG